MPRRTPAAIRSDRALAAERAAAAAPTDAADAAGALRARVTNAAGALFAAATEAADAATDAAETSAAAAAADAARELVVAVAAATGCSPSDAASTLVETVDEEIAVVDAAIKDDTACAVVAVKTEKDAIKADANGAAAAKTTTGSLSCLLCGHRNC